MKGTKKFLTFLLFSIFFIAVAFTTSCSVPIGGLLIDNNRNYIKAEPQRYVYRKDDDPFKVQHVKLLYVFEGRDKYIDINDNEVIIKIINDPGHPEEMDSFDKTEEGYPFKSKGIKTVVILYLDMKTDYPIEVVDPEEFPGLPNDGGVTIITVWS